MTSPSSTSSQTLSQTASLVGRYRDVRGQSERLAEPLEIEDYVVQSMPDVSPTKWHLAHTSWFFETFILNEAIPNYRSFHPQFAYLFNSYYLQAGERHCRPKRGLISRPTVNEVYQYRQYIDEQMLQLIEQGRGRLLAEFAPLIEIGLNHEQQHQELLLTDIKHVLSSNPLRPAYQVRQPRPEGGNPPMRWVRFDEGIRWIGHDGDGFAYDNEGPRHRVFLNAFEMASRPVTCGEYRAFIEDGGYHRGELWLSQGWATAQQEQWEAPLYWERRDGQWWLFDLSGMRPVSDEEPVCHVSLFEADAFARWSGRRLPTEAEWETAAEGANVDGNFVEKGIYHPQPGDAHQASIAQLFGDVWEWTGSAYLGYPGYRPPPGSIGEYNGKFMCNQFVLRGGSCATPRSHVRPTYRNFFPPDARWQFTGIRLARDV